MTLVMCPIIVEVVVVVVVNVGPHQCGHGALWVIDVNVGEVACHHQDNMD